MPDQTGWWRSDRARWVLLALALVLLIAAVAVAVRFVVPPTLTPVPVASVSRG